MNNLHEHQPTDSTLFAGRIGIVTGASAGIGLAIAESLLERGSRLVINARRADRLDRLAQQFGRERCFPVAGDATDTVVISDLLEQCRSRFGRAPDLVVVNAGRGLRGGVVESDTEDWETVVRINFTAAARLMREAFLAMRALDDSHGRVGESPRLARDIILLGSTVGRNLSPFSSFYGSVKAAAHMAAESVRRAAAKHGIRVTTLEPGVVESEFQDAAGYDRAQFGEFMRSISPVLTPSDIARLVTFIISQPPGVHMSEVMVRPTRQEYP